MYSFPSLEPVYCSISGSNCCFLTCIQISQEAGQVVWYSHLFKDFPKFVVIHKGFSAVNEAKAIFFWIPLLFLWSNGCWQFDLCFPLHFLNPAWRPGSSWFTYCWSLTWRTSRITLRPCEMSATCAGVWGFFGIAILWDWNENWPFPILWPLLSYLCWYSECSTLTAFYFRIWNSSAEIPSPSIAMFVVVLPKVHLISHSRMSGQNVSDKPWSSGEGNANHFSILALRTPWTYGQARR